MYWKDIFVCQSVWSDNEDGVLIDNKPWDVMGRDALAENIISANYPNDDAKLFDTNEFLDLDEDTEPDCQSNCSSTMDS